MFQSRTQKLTFTWTLISINEFCLFQQELQISEAVFRRCSVKRCSLNFTKFTGKQLCQSLFFNKVADLRPAKETLAHLFSCELCEFFKNTFFYRTTLVAFSEIYMFDFLLNTSTQKLWSHHLYYHKSTFFTKKIS